MHGGNIFLDLFQKTLDADDNKCAQKYVTATPAYMYTHINSWGMCVVVVQVFVQMAPFLKIYAPFLTKTEWVLKQVVEVKQSDPKFKQLLDRKSSMGIESLESLIIKTVQRIPR